MYSILLYTKWTKIIWKTTEETIRWGWNRSIKAQLMMDDDDDDDDDLFNITLYQTIKLIKRTGHKKAVTESDSTQHSPYLQANKKHPQFHNTGGFSIKFQTASHCFLYSVRWIWTTITTLFLYDLYYYRCLRIPCDLFPSSVPSQTPLCCHLYVPYATCPAHLVFLDLTTLIKFVTTLITFGDEYKLWNSLLCSFLQPPVTSAHFGSNSFLSALFPDIPNLCFSLNMTDQVSHLYTRDGSRNKMLLTKRMQIFSNLVYI